jgi:hypothetical protein
MINMNVEKFKEKIQKNIIWVLVLKNLLNLLQLNQKLSNLQIIKLKNLFIKEF